MYRTGAIQGTSRDCLYQELELEFLLDRCRFRKQNRKLQIPFLSFFMFENGKTWETLYSIGVKLLPRLRMEFSHLNEHKLHQKSHDCVSPMCNCGVEIKTSKDFFLALPILCQ